MSKQDVAEERLNSQVQTAQAISLNVSDNNLPLHWRTVRLEEVASYINGYAFKPSDWGTKGLPIIRIQNLNDPTKPYNYFAGQIPERYRVREGDILISWSASLGTYMWSGIDAWLNQHIFKAIVKEDTIFRDYFYWVMTRQIEYIAAEQTYGSTMKHVVQKSFLNSHIPLPPLSEQHAIAKVLRTTYKAIQSRREELELELERKAALMEYLFTHGTRGETTKQTEIGEIPESWQVVELGEIITLHRGYDLPSRDRKPGIVPIISSSGISGTHSEAKVTAPGVVTGRYGTIGEVFYIEQDFWPLNTTLYVSEFRRVTPQFVAFLLRTLNFNIFNDKSTVPGVNRNDLHRIKTVLPPPSEQQDIVDVLSTHDTKLSVLGQESALLEELFHALLEELMTGRLSTLPLNDEGDTYD